MTLTPEQIQSLHDVTADCTELLVALKHRMMPTVPYETVMIIDTHTNAYLDMKIEGILDHIEQILNS